MQWGTSDPAQARLKMLLARRVGLIVGGDTFLQCSSRELTLVVRPLAARGLLLLFMACGLSPCGAPPQGGSFWR